MLRSSCVKSIGFTTIDEYVGNSASSTGFQNGSSCSQIHNFQTKVTKISQIFHKVQNFLFQNIFKFHNFSSKKLPTTNRGSNNRKHLQNRYLTCWIIWGSVIPRGNLLKVISAMAKWPQRLRKLIFKPYNKFLLHGKFKRALQTPKESWWSFQSEKHSLLEVHL